MAETYWDCVLQESDLFSQNGLPKQPFPNGWKGKSGLYAAGFTRKGLSGASLDATRIADDIGQVWKEETRLKKRSLLATGDSFHSFDEATSSVDCLGVLLAKKIAGYLV